jgi:hypothetical protein
MNRFEFLFASISLCAFASGCGAEAFDEQTEDEDISVAESALVSGASVVRAGGATQESEAVITITKDTSGVSHTIVTANADHLNFTVYSDGGTVNAGADDTRTVWPGASHMAIWHRAGLSGTYTEQRMAPPDGGGLWGDPAIASNGKYVYATSLRIPKGRFPFNGVSHGAIVNKVGKDGPESMGAFLAGACIARSSDYGQTFSMTLDDCPYDDGHFYDGGAVVATATGKIFSAFLDVGATQIDVWRTDTATSAIYMTPDPFPGKTMVSHPRMRFNDGVIYLMAADLSNNLWMTSYVSGAWKTPVLVASNIAQNMSAILSNDVEIRQGSGFDFSAYLIPFDSSPQLAFVITTDVGGKSVLRSGSCSPSGSSWTCGLTAGSTNTTVDCFAPAIATTTYSPGFGAVGLSTKITYQRAKTVEGQVALYVSPWDFSAAQRLGSYQIPCPDFRGYWGDYDSMAVGEDGFHRVFSDSTGGTCVRQTFTQRLVGVSEFVMPIAP